MEIHKLKTIQPFFDDILSGIKKFEVRKNDRNYQVGDTLILYEYDPILEQYLHRLVMADVIYVLDNADFCKEGFVVMGIEVIKITF